MPVRQANSGTIRTASDRVLHCWIQKEPLLYESQDILWSVIRTAAICNHLVSVPSCPASQHSPSEMAEFWKTFWASTIFVSDSKNNAISELSQVLTKSRKELLKYLRDQIIPIIGYGVPLPIASSDAGSDASNYSSSDSLKQDKVATGSETSAVEAQSVSLCDRLCTHCKKR